jgi:hypothetical protein
MDGTRIEREEEIYATNLVCVYIFIYLLLKKHMNGVK